MLKKVYQEISGNTKRGKLMADKNTNEFRVKQYVNDLEKSLNYVVAVFFTMIGTSIYYICQKQDWQIILPVLLL